LPTLRVISAKSNKAFVVQHRAHLADVLASRAQAGLTAAFAASCALS
jgi:hypothetical protein